jgi:hypothetical protein
MGTTQPAECLWIEKVIREEFATRIEVECRTDFDSKDYIVWLTINGTSTPVCFTMEEYQDDNWKPIIQAALEELNQ